MEKGECYNFLRRTCSTLPYATYLLFGPTPGSLYLTPHHRRRQSQLLGFSFEVADTTQNSRWGQPYPFEFCFFCVGFGDIIRVCFHVRRVWPKGLDSMAPLGFVWVRVLEVHLSIWCGKL